MDAAAWAVAGLGILMAIANSLPSAILMAIPILWWRQFPGVAFALAIGCGSLGVHVPNPLDTRFGEPALGYLGPTFGLVIAGACYLASRYARGRWWLPAPLIGIAASVIAGFDWLQTDPQNLIVFLSATLVGTATGHANALLMRNTALRDEAASERVRTQESEEHSRWLELRTELARELHDLVGHHVTAMVVQAEAGLVGDPHRALTEIGDSGRRALGELDSLVRYLRDPTDGGPVTTVQRLQNIDKLATPLERHGITVHVNVESDLETSAPLELATYRIAQEALTNVARHAQATTAWVTVEDAGEHVHIRVSDDGIGPPQQNTRGAGLAGIAERVAAHSGVWTIGDRDGGGTSLDAYLASEGSTS